MKLLRLVSCVALLSGCPGPSTMRRDAYVEPDADVDDAHAPLDTGTALDAPSDLDAAPPDGAVGPIDAPAPADAGSDAASTADAGGTALDHLLLSEIGVSGAGYEFFEITNPTSAPIALDDYYVSDNAAYHGIAAGSPWTPVGTAQTDFLAGFPPGTTIAAGAALVVATSPLFEAAFGRCPDLVLMDHALSCATASAPAMVAPANGGIGTMGGSLISNDREMLVLFRWNGVEAVVRDVDYVTWGTTFDEATRADKTSVPGYAPDTAAASQHPAAAPPATQSLVRCADEVGETSSGGNGLAGHDETSERLDLAFRVTATPTPGASSGCP